VRLGTKIGGRGGLEDVLTTGGDRRETPDFEEGRRRYLRPAAAVSMAGGVLALGWLRELAEEVWLGVADFMAASASSGRLHGRRIEDDRRRHKTPAAALLAHARVSGQGSGSEATTFYRAEVAAALACGSRKRRARRRLGLELGLVSSLGTTEGRR
jgi:hypothetical protein